MQEVKWVGYPDTTFELVPFEILLKRYCVHEEFLLFVSYWHDLHTCPADVRRGMNTFLRHLRLVGL